MQIYFVPRRRLRQAAARPRPEAGSAANHSAEYGIFIGEETARGKGFGTETARLFTEFGFAQLHLHRISLRLLAENEPARRSYEKAGFALEGIFHDMVLLDGQYRDVVFMARLAPAEKEG